MAGAKASFSANRLPCRDFSVKLHSRLPPSLLCTPHDQAPLALHYPGHPGAVALAPGILPPGIDGMPMQAAPQLTMMNHMNPMAYKGAGAMSGAAPVLAGSMGDAYEYDAQHQQGGERAAVGMS